MNEPAVLVEASDLRRDYGPLRAVDDVDVRLERGQVLGLLGPNGAGKTSTLQMICGALAPSNGAVRINGVDLLGEPRRAKRALGYLPESPPLYRDMTVREYLDFCAALHAVPRGRRAVLRERAIERCGLADTRSRLIGNLSKGYQQRVGIAQAILHEPAVVVLDEPTVGLDPIQIREIRALVAELGREHGVILSTHILAEVQAVCSHVQIIHRGRTVWSDALAALDRADDEHAVAVCLRAQVDRQSLTDLPGVVSARPHADDRWWLELEPGWGIEQLADTLVGRGWGLLELAPQRRSLEQVFVAVTATDTAETTR
jgi:ABC-2 type transport system ATP-binding protein